MNELGPVILLGLFWLFIELPDIVTFIKREIIEYRWRKRTGG